MSTAIAASRTTMSGESSASSAAPTIRSRARFAMPRASHERRCYRAAVGGNLRVTSVAIGDHTGSRMTYDVVTCLPSGKERVQNYASDDSLAAGDVLRLGGRFWLVESI